MSAEHYVTRDELNGSLVRIEANQNSGFQRLEARLDRFESRLCDRVTCVEDKVDIVSEKRISKVVATIIALLSGLLFASVSALTTIAIVR